MTLDGLVDYLNGFLDIPDHPDYATALNGLQVEGPSQVSRVAAAVDTSESVIRDAAASGAQLLLVHHGLLWDGLRPVTGRRFRRLKGLMAGGVALYSAHLPLDAHPEVGNCILLSRALGLDVQGRFGWYKGSPIGFWGYAPSQDRGELVTSLESAVEGPVHLLPGGPEHVHKVAVITGGGGSFIEEAAREGMDTLVTGEGSHHTFVDAGEYGVNVLYGGHYATETFGVRALASHLAERFDLSWTFLHHPSGM